jgi:hypothetical protein
MPHEPAPLLVFSDDWARHPSSCQFLVQRLLGERRVLWVNTLGTRRPRPCWSDLRRGLGKLRQWFGPSISSAAASSPATPDQPIVLNPPMWPDFTTPLARRVNTALLTRALRSALHRHCTRPPIVLTTVPLIADLVGRIPADRWIYYCVDDWATWPGLDHDSLVESESRLLGRIDAAAAVSQPLVDKLAQRGCHATLITHGVDPAAWSRPHSVDHPLLDALALLPRPLAICWGLIDGRLDREAIVQLARATPGSIALIGPVGVGGQALLDVPNIHHFQPVPQPVLAHAARLADALLMFYQSNHPAMRQAQPLKLMEYLATDRPIVCLDMVAARPWADCCDLVRRERFAQRVLHRCSVGPATSQLSARARRLGGESWDAKAAQLRSLVDETRPDANLLREAC